MRSRPSRCGFCRRVRIANTAARSSDVRVEVHLAERRRARHELAIDARLVAERQRVRHLDDHHAIEQRLVLLLLQELVELGQVRVREDRLVEVDQREARHLDVLLLRQRQQQIQELALDLEDLDHLEHAAARGIDGARPGPGPRVAFVADVGDLRQIDGAHEVRDVGRRRIVRRIRADADARGLGEEDALDGEAHEVALELVVEPRARVRRQLALNVDAVRRAELRPQARRDQVQRRLVQRRALQRVQRAVVGVAVLLEAALQQDHERRLAARRRPEQQQQPSADVGARGRGLEVIDDALERAVDAEQLAGEQCGGRSARRCPVARSTARRVAIRAQHVVDVLMRRARQLARDLWEECRAGTLRKCHASVVLDAAWRRRPDRR